MSAPAVPQPAAARPAAPAPADVVAGRLAWLRGTGSEDEARLVEAALLARTDNGPHDGDPDA